MTAVIMLGSVGGSSGKKIVKEIVKQGLSPCVYVQQMTSISKNGAGKEHVAIIKTNQKNVSAILNLIGKHKFPEFLVFKATGWKPYLQFLESGKFKCN